MNQDYIVSNNWSIIEEGFEADRVKSSESLFSIGNGAMGQRANFEEEYSGDTFQGSYIAGVYYPDKTKVGWWKNGYPESFAKVLNSCNWIGLNVWINNVSLDLYKTPPKTFSRELNMKEGWLSRSFNAVLPAGEEIEVETKRFISVKYNEVGAIEYHIKAVNFSGEITFSPYLDAGIMNEDTNYDEYFWETFKIPLQMQFFSKRMQ